MTPHDIKNSIWQLAVQGKLVEQYPEEGTGEELFQLIQAEKEALIKAEKIKKSKILPVISDDDKPFDLPDSWCWVRLEDLCSLITDGTHKTPSYTTDGVRFLSVKDISNGYFDLSNTKFISQTEHVALTQRCKPEQGDVLICRIGTLGKALAVDVDIEFSIFVSLGLIKPIKKELAKYIETVINSGYGFSWIQKVKVGGGTHTFKINLDDLRLFPIPLPPIGEQQRIIAKLEGIAPLIDRYEKAWSKLEEFNKRFPVDMQKSILQTAIQGKLVEQRAEEGTGEELYQQIQTEKQSLIKAGKIKKEKPLPEITDDEIPFDIPESWKWCRLRDICTKIVDGDHNPPAGVKYPTDFLMLSATNINNDTLVDLNKVRYVTEEEFAVENQRTRVEINDIFFTIVGSMGRSCVYRGGYNLCFQRSVSVLTTLIMPEFLKYVLDTPYVQFFMYANATGTAQKGFYLNQVENLVIPLPPLAEQKRIVAKLEQILPLCERLK